MERGNHERKTDEPFVLQPNSVKRPRSQPVTTMKGLSTSIRSLGRSLFEAMALANRDFMVLVFTFKMNVIEFVQQAWKGLLVLAIFVAGARLRASSIERRQQRYNW